jgi:hypothetical protein
MTTAKIKEVCRYAERFTSGRRKASSVEAGSNTVTVTLRVVGGYVKGNLESETVKYGRESNGTRSRE